MKELSKLLILAVSGILSIILTACKEPEQSGPQGSFQVTNDSMVHFITDQNGLTGRISVLNQPLEITDATNANQIGSRQASSKGQPVDSVALSLVAETQAVSLDGQTVQATDIALKENKAYISYNMAGDAYLGALQVIDLKDETSPVTITEVVFRDIDLNAVYVKGSDLYIVGAADPTSRSIATPAVLMIMSLKQGIPQSSIKVIDLPSFAGTDVLVKNGYIFATVGADDGGLVRLMASDPDSFDSEVDFTSIEDARSLAVEGGFLGVLKGTEGQITYYQTSTLATSSITLKSASPERQVAFAGTATIPNSKSTIDMVSEVSVVALGNGGVKAILSESSSETPVFEVAALTGYEGLNDSLTVTNAVAVNQNLLFRANGEAGVDLYKLSKKIRTVSEGDTVSVTRLGFLEFEDLASANGLYYRQGLLFVADGLGGMKIVLVDRDVSSTSDEDEDSAEQDQDEEDEVDNAS